MATARWLAVVAVMALLATTSGCAGPSDPYAGRSFSGTATSYETFSDGATCTAPNLEATLSIDREGKATIRMPEVPRLGYGPDPESGSTDSACFIMTDVPMVTYVARGLHADLGATIPVTGCETGALTEARGAIVMTKEANAKLTATVAYDCMNPLHPAEVMYRVTASLQEVVR